MSSSYNASRQTANPANPIENQPERRALFGNFWTKLTNVMLTALTLLLVVVWGFPVYWAIITSITPETDVVNPNFWLIPERITFAAYLQIFNSTPIWNWYVNSFVTASCVTFLALLIATMSGFAISQIKFPGRRLLFGLIVASFMVPYQALIINHFLIVAGMGLTDTWIGVILPQIILPITVIVFKQFFDAVPREFHEAAELDGASDLQILFWVYLPMNWGVVTALGCLAFIGAWNAFLWPFLAIRTDEMMTLPVGITRVKDAFGSAYARELAGAVLAALPIALLYLIFQRRVTQAITLSAGIKG